MRVSGGGDLWVANSDGSTPELLFQCWDAPTFDWSPESGWLVFAAQDQNFNRDIYITPADGSLEPFNLSRHPDFEGSPTWSPDGRRIAFTGRRLNNEMGLFYVDLKLEDWDKFGRGVHTLVNLMPNGKYLMEDFCYAGGLPAVLRELGSVGLLHKDVLTVNGKTMWENVKDAPCHNRDVITPFKKPFKKNTGIAVLRGNLCPGGAIIKPSAATPAGPLPARPPVHRRAKCSSKALRAVSRSSAPSAPDARTRR